MVLVLDDLHDVTDTTVLGLLDHLLERIPARLRLMIATRYDPPLSLPRLRVRRQVAEFHLDELRFTASEAELLFNTVLGLDVTAAQLALLIERTEGWAAGISLLANSLEWIGSATDRAAFLDHVHRTNRVVFEFLAEEVLNRQDPFVRMFCWKRRCCRISPRHSVARSLGEPIARPSSTRCTGVICSSSLWTTTSHQPPTSTRIWTKPLISLIGRR